MSRPTAGRLVARAKANGLVRIEVVVPPTLRDDLHADERAPYPHARDVLGTGLADAFTAHGLAVITHVPARSWAAPFQIVHAHKRGI